MKNQQKHSNAQKQQSTNAKNGQSKSTLVQQRKESLSSSQEDDEQQFLNQMEDFDDDLDNQEEEKRIITDKEFYKQMQKLKDRGSNAVPPKKSASAYIIFGKEKRAEILKRNPVAKVTEVVKEIAQCWGSLSKEERQKYKDQARKDKERYDKELRQLESYSELLKKPKKCLSAYMIFVKETRPLIVDKHPEMGALQVMQEVGKQWQSMTKEDRKYFKDKADRDKIRYLDEQKAFYDEVEKIGQKVGTVTTKEGQVVVASSSGNCQQQHEGGIKNPRIKQVKSITEVQQINQQQTLPVKRRLANCSKTSGNQQLNKRQKHEDKGQEGGNSNTQNKQNQSQQSQGVEDKPKKPLSAYIYFSQEFREIIRGKFPFLTVAQIMKVVSYRWASLSKDQKEPFEKIANEDKQRYDREINDFKKGIFQGRSSTPQIKLVGHLDSVSKALEVSEDILQYLNIKSTEEQVDNEIEDQEGLDEAEDDEEEEQQQQISKQSDTRIKIEQIQPQKINSQFEQPISKRLSTQNSNLIQIPLNDLGNSSLSNLKVQIENFDEQKIRKDSFILSNPTTLKIDDEAHHHEIGQIDSRYTSQQQQQFLPTQQFTGYEAYAPIQLPSISQFSMNQANINNKMYNFANPLQSPFAFAPQMFQQQELNDREHNRKTSMSFQYPPMSTQLNPTNNSQGVQNVLQSPINSPLLGGMQYSSIMGDDNDNLKPFLMQMPMSLPPRGQQQPQQLPPMQFGQQLPPYLNQQTASTTPRFNQMNSQQSFQGFQSYSNMQNLIPNGTQNDIYQQAISPMLTSQNAMLANQGLNGLSQQAMIPNTFVNLQISMQNAIFGGEPSQPQNQIFKRV